ncbi:hypothetical protein M0812_00166 [Anaeramoeba flamelloides]|uniref:Uncharacterized protein n=1 Tax=Anaeramoeba flamelloides TaxID=1746091 RepID=A0AAV8A2G0_9EUKA|nr:hypothetical protein M0812_00166 [Anaeramoeba flamelloides]
MSQSKSLVVKYRAIYLCVVIPSSLLLTFIHYWTFKQIKRIKKRDKIYKEGSLREAVLANSQASKKITDLLEEEQLVWLSGPVNGIIKKTSLYLFFEILSYLKRNRIIYGLTASRVFVFGLRDSQDQRIWNIGETPKLAYYQKKNGLYSAIFKTDTLYERRRGREFYNYMDIGFKNIHSLITIQNYLGEETFSTDTRSYPEISTDDHPEINNNTNTNLNSNTIPNTNSNTNINGVDNVNNAQVDENKLTIDYNYEQNDLEKKLLDSSENNIDYKTQNTNNSNFDNF